MYSFSSVQHDQALKDSFNSPFDVTHLQLPLAGFIVEVFVGDILTRLNVDYRSRRLTVERIRGLDRAREPRFHC
jgi:hypothetical protein